MKKIFLIVLCVAVVFSLTSCIYNEREIALMFNSFNKSDNIILLTNDELVVNEKHYDLADIKYNEQQCNIVFLEKDGFYSYAFNQDNLSVEFFFTLYEGFKTTSLGTETLPSEIINAFFCDNCFWFRMDDPTTDEFQQMYYSWCVDAKQISVIDGDKITDEYEYSIDSNRSERYSFSYPKKFFGNYLEITDNESGITKRIDSSVLDTFEEGKQIKNAKSSTDFNIAHAYEDNGTIYLASIFGAGFLGEPCYCYVFKWNFETEECEFYTSVYFELYQEWVTDMYIK